MKNLISRRKTLKIWTAKGENHFLNRQTQTTSSTFWSIDAIDTVFCELRAIEYVRKSCLGRNQYILIGSKTKQSGIISFEDLFERANRFLRQLQPY